MEDVEVGGPRSGWIEELLDRKVEEFRYLSKISLRVRIRSPVLVCHRSGLAVQFGVRYRPWTADVDREFLEFLQPNIANTDKVPDDNFPSIAWVDSIHRVDHRRFPDVAAELRFERDPAGSAIGIATASDDSPRDERARRDPPPIPRIIPCSPSQKIHLAPRESRRRGAHVAVVAGPRRGAYRGRLRADRPAAQDALVSPARAPRRAIGRRAAIRAADADRVAHLRNISHENGTAEAVP